MGGLAFEGHGDLSQANLSGVGQLHLEQDVLPIEEVDQHQVVAGQVPFVHQDVSWTTGKNCLEDSTQLESLGPVFRVNV